MEDETIADFRFAIADRVFQLAIGNGQLAID
jgi:hypothetical protein